MLKLDQLIWYSDSSHAWLRVNLDDAWQAESHGVGFSAWSYKSHRYAYLEEDCDAPKFLKYLLSIGVSEEFLKTIPEKHTDARSQIRNKAPYKLRG